MNIEEDDALFNIELEALLESILVYYGYDFRNYSKAHLKRRVKGFLGKHKINSISKLQHKVLREKETFSKLLLHFSVNTTEMFRDPQFYNALKTKVFPVLSTYPFFKVWHAGCSTGEEVYSLAVLLKESGLYDRAQIYATDFNTIALEKAKEGIYSIEDVRKYTQNYQKSGGEKEFSNYYIARHDHIIINNELKKNILFATHNLAIDHVFSEMNVIICRNVLIYFNNKLQTRVYKIFIDSLVPGGYLCLGSKEALKGEDVEQQFEIIEKKYKIFKNKYP